RNVGQLAERLRVGGGGQIGQRDGAASQIDATGPAARRAIADEAEVGVELGGEGAIGERELARMRAELEARRLHAVDARGARGVERAVAGLDVERERRLARRRAHIERAVAIALRLAAQADAGVPNR